MDNKLTIDQVRKGMKVRILKGAFIRSTSGRKNKTTAKVNYTVKVFGTRPGERKMGTVYRHYLEGVLLDERRYLDDKPKYLLGEMEKRGLPLRCDVDSPSVKALWEAATLVPSPWHKTYVDSEGCTVEVYDAILNYGKFEVEWLVSGYYTWSDSRNVELVQEVAAAA